MKRYLNRWMWLTTLLSPTLFATSCSTDLRDSVMSGLLDYVTATTTAAALTVLPFDDPFAQE
jgi:hypothetical protein